MPILSYKLWYHQIFDRHHHIAGDTAGTLHLKNLERRSNLPLYIPSHNIAPNMVFSKFEVADVSVWARALRG